MLSNAYFLAKFRFDKAENEPAKNLQQFANFPNLLILTPSPDVLPRRPGPRRRLRRVEVDVPLLPLLRRRGLPALALGGAAVWSRKAVCPCARAPPDFGKISANVRSFSAVSAPIVASKYAFYRIVQNLPDYLAEMFEISKFRKF